MISGPARSLMGTAAACIFLGGCAGAGRPGEVRPMVPPFPSGYTALCQAAWSHSGKKHRVRLAVAYQKPSRLRLEILDPLGSNRGVLVTREDGAMRLDPARRTYRVYPSGEEALEDLAGFPFPADFLGELLLGPDSLKSSLNCESSAVGEEKADLACRSTGPEISAVFSADRHSVQARLEPDRHFEIRWRDYRREAPPPPGKVRIEEVGSDRSLDLVIRELRLEPPASELFVLTPPPGFQTEGGDRIPPAPGGALP